MSLTRLWNSLPSYEHQTNIQNTVDRVSLTLDALDVKTSQFDSQIYSFQLEIKNLKGKHEPYQPSS